MNGHFSYELDERQIKLMMQDVELDDDSTFWDKFEGLCTNESKSSIEFKLPKLHISASVFVPVFFILIIGLLSVILFSLVDFKKKENVTEEVQYKPIPKPVVKKLAVTKPTPIQKEKTVQVALDTVTNNVNQHLDSVSVKVSESLKQKEVVKVLPSKKDSVSISNNTAIKKQKSEPRKKKRRRRVVGEEIPTIASPIRLEEKSVEPDLDLK